MKRFRVLAFVSCATVIAGMLYPKSRLRFQRLKLMYAAYTLDRTRSTWQFWDFYHEASLERNGLTKKRDATDRVKSFMQNAQMMGYLQPVSAEEFEQVGPMTCEWELTDRGRNRFERGVRPILAHAA